MKKGRNIFAASLLLCLAACEEAKNDFDASGTFEAMETLISAEANGKILAFTAQEGAELKAGQVIGYIDSTQLHLQRLQLEQNKKAILSGRPNTGVQTKALKEQLATAKSDRDRTENLVKSGVANPKQLDDANARVATLEAQISAQENSLYTANTTIVEQAALVDIQLQDVQDRLAKCKITNPVNGTVLTTFVEPFEMTGAGRPLYKIADLTTLTLRAYITGDQLPMIKLNQPVRVFTDKGDGGYQEVEGTVTWINSKAEFTPKTILTKNERANLVYAIKVLVPNDGSYKIGMYGEVQLTIDN